MDEDEDLVTSMSRMSVFEYMSYPPYCPSSGVPYTVKFDWDHLALITPFDPDFTEPTQMVAKWLSQLDPCAILGIIVDQLVDDWASVSKPFPKDDRIRDVATTMFIETTLGVYAHVFQSIPVSDTQFACSYCRTDPTCMCGVNGVTYWYYFDKGLRESSRELHR